MRQTACLPGSRARARVVVVIVGCGGIVGRAADPAFGSSIPRCSACAKIQHDAYTHNWIRPDTAGQSSRKQSSAPTRAPPRDGYRAGLGRRLTTPRRTSRLPNTTRDSRLTTPPPTSQREDADAALAYYILRPPRPRSLMRKISLRASKLRRAGAGAPPAPHPPAMRVVDRRAPPSTAAATARSTASVSPDARARAWGEKRRTSGVGRRGALCTRLAWCSGTRTRTCAVGLHTSPWDRGARASFGILMPSDALCRGGYTTAVPTTSS